MSVQNYLTPPEIAEATIQTAVKKVKTPVIHMILLGILAGVFIAFASEGCSRDPSVCFKTVIKYALVIGPVWLSLWTAVNHKANADGYHDPGGACALQLCVTGKSAGH